MNAFLSLVVLAWVLMCVMLAMVAAHWVGGAMVVVLIGLCVGVLYFYDR